VEPLPFERLQEGENILSLFEGWAFSRLQTGRLQLGEKRWIIQDH